MQDISADKLGQPIYYFCNWDYKYLDIYFQVREIFKGKGKDIILIELTLEARKLPVSVKHHKNKRCVVKQFSGLEYSHFAMGRIETINSLISRDEWIEEKSIDLIEVFNSKPKFIYKKQGNPDTALKRRFFVGKTFLAYAYKSILNEESTFFDI